jgi:hypothetical protein
MNTYTNNHERTNLPRSDLLTRSRSRLRPPAVRPPLELEKLALRRGDVPSALPELSLRLLQLFRERVGLLIFYVQLGRTWLGFCGIVGSEVRSQD